MRGLDMATATAVLKHFYSGAHVEYPHCPICLPDKVRSLRARLRAKYFGVTVGG